MNPLISVIITAYNGERYLSEAIESVLSQESVNVEIIIVDDGSSDNTATIIKKYQSSHLRALFQTNQGQGAAYNHALQYANGDFVAFLDQDDIYPSNKLFLQSNILKSSPDIDMVFGYVEQFISPELPDEVKAKRECPSQPIPGFLPSVAMFRRKCFAQVGLFNTEWKVGMCIDWCIRAKEQGLKDFTLPDILLRRRIHDKNQTVVARDHYKNYIQVIKEKLDRARLREMSSN